jgi:hypothetical protein
MFREDAKTRPQTLNDIHISKVVIFGLGKNLHIQSSSWADENMRKVHQIIHEDNIQLTMFITF